MHNKYKTTMLIFAAFLLTGCQNAAISSFDGDALEVLESSVWDWTGENHCQSYVQSIKKEAGQLLFTWKEAKTGKFGSEVVYDINKAQGAYFELTMLPPKGSKEAPVDWNLVVKSDSQYCWHRSDWLITQCTKPMIKC